MAQKVTISPVTRVEGHGKVTIHLNDNGEVVQSRLHIVEFRGFERFIQGRPYWEAPVLVQRLCGICPVSHHLAAAKAMDVIVGAGKGDGLTPTAEKIRRLMHYGQMFQSHALHFFHLASPDLLFGIDAPAEKRNVIALAKSKEYRELAVQGVMMRKFGQEIIRATAGKKIHGNGAVPGGVNKSLTPEERDHFLNGAEPLRADKMISWAEAAMTCSWITHGKNTGRCWTTFPVPVEPSQPGRQGRCTGSVPRRFGPLTPKARRSWTTWITRSIWITSARRCAQLELHEIPISYRARQGERMVPWWPAGTSQHLRFHPDSQSTKSL
jgi:hypothetical protein